MAGRAILMTVHDGLDGVGRQQMVISGDGILVGDTAANQHGVDAKGMGTLNVGCNLVTDHYHISGAATSQSLFKDGDMGLAEPVKL